MLARDDLYKLEEYAEKRNDFKQNVLSIKKNRNVQLGENITLLFENKLTIQYQIQEMLRIEKIFEADAIQEELDAYNPLIPNGKNLKATMLIEYNNVQERREKLKELKGVERKIWIKLGASAPVFPIADEDLEREDDTKTSAVHFLRWEFSESSIKGLKENPNISMGVDHDKYSCNQIITKSIVDELTSDFN